MTIADLSTIEGRTYPAGRRTRNLVGGASPIQAKGFCMGHVTLEPGGGQVPWHNHEQEEVYFIVHGTAEACVGTECRAVGTGQALYVPPLTYHQLTNTGPEPLVMLYAYSRPATWPTGGRSWTGVCPARARMPRPFRPGPGRSARGSAR